MKLKSLVVENKHERKLHEDAKKNDWTVISMKDDRKTIFTFEP